MSKLFRNLLIAFASVLAVSQAQSFLGSITGTVLDSTGATVPGAKINLTEVTTGVQHNTITNAAGEYLFANLAPGRYQVVIGASGFKDVKSAEIVLTAQAVGHFDARLEVGSSAQTVEVASTPPTVNMENAEVDGLVEHKEFEDLPINSRSSISYFFLNSFNYQGMGSSYSIGGLRGQQTNFTIDGVTSNASLYGGQSGNMLEESLEAVREVKIMASNNSAEFSNVATVVIESRAGENDYHGSAFYLTKNNWFNARSFFSGPNPPGPIDHQFSTSFGGPVLIPKVYNGKNKTFFFFTWEQERFPYTPVQTANVPTPAMQQGDFSYLLTQNPAIVITDPTTGKPFPGNIIPSNRISPVSLNIQKFLYPQPNLTGSPNAYTNDWIGPFPQSSWDNRYVTRMDHVISNTDSLSGRLSIRPAPAPVNAFGSFPQFYFIEYRRTFNAYISETHLFSPAFLNEFRIGFARDKANEPSPFKGGQVVQQLGLQGINTNTDLTGVPTVNFQNFSGLSDLWDNMFWSETFELLDNVTVVKGRHNIKMGVLERYNRPAQTNIPANSTDFGEFNFTGFATGFDYADFLLGIPNTSSLAYRAPNSYLRYTQTGLFIQDDFHITPRLTMNVGLRWEYNQPPVDTHNLRFSFNRANGDLVVPTAAQLSEVSSFFPSSIPIETAAQAGLPSRSLLFPQWHDLAPRFSFAYRPIAGDPFVIRAGYGIFYSPLISTVIGNFEGGPFASQVGYTNQIVNGAPLFAFPDAFGGSGSIPSQSVSPVNPHVRTPYVQQWNFTLERELPFRIVARAGYRGFMGVEYPYTRDLNMPPPSTNPANQNVFYYPNYYQVLWSEDGGIQKLHALDTALERKLSAGVTFQAQYTLAKNLSDAGDDGETNSIMDPYDRALDMGNVAFMPRQRLVATSLYELPLGPGQRFGANLNPLLRHVMGGWQLTGAFTWQTGQFLTPTFASPDVTNNRSLLTGLNRPDCLGNPNISNPTINNWFNEAVFAIPAPGTYGTCGRGIIEGPGIVTLNLGLMKNFRLKERATLQLRATAANALNHPIFLPPSNGNFPFVPVINSTNGNVITGVNGDPEFGNGTRNSLGAPGFRDFQVGARIDF